jgi:hypothetical protein
MPAVDREGDLGAWELVDVNIMLVCHFEPL